MSFPAQLLWGSAAGPASALGGTLEVDLDARPSRDAGAVPRLTIYGPTGSVYALDAAASIEGPSTVPTLTQAVHAGTGATQDDPLPVTSTSGLTARMVCQLGSGAGARPLEMVRIRHVLDATHVRLFGPVLHDHELGASLGGRRLTAAIAGSAVPDLFRWGRAVWEYGSEGSASRNRTVQTAVDVVRYPLRMLATEDSLREIDPAVYARFADQRDPRELLDIAWRYVNRRLGAKGVLGFGASEALALPTALYAMAWETRSWGQDWQARADMWTTQADAAIAEAVELFGSDTDQDGVTTADEQPVWRTVRVHRA